jgi:hypothetical protein
MQFYQLHAPTGLLALKDCTQGSKANDKRKLMKQKRG